MEQVVTHKKSLIAKLFLHRVKMHDKLKTLIATLAVTVICALERCSVNDEMAQVKMSVSTEHMNIFAHSVSRIRYVMPCLTRCSFKWLALRWRRWCYGG